MTLKKWQLILISSLIVASLLGAAYFFFEKLLTDRQSAMSFKEPEPRRQYTQDKIPNGTTTVTYSAKELEEARKNGRLPKGMETQGRSQAAIANDAAVQRTLRTIDEINRVNEMNRRLQEQQERMNKQRN